MESQLQIKKETMGYVKELKEGVPDIFLLMMNSRRKFTETDI